MARPTNLNQVASVTLLKAFNKELEENFFTHSRYEDENYLKTEAELEDFNEINQIPITLTSFLVSDNIVRDEISAITFNIDDYTKIEKDYTFDALRKSLDVDKTEVVTNYITLNKEFDIPINILVKFSQYFKIPAGSTISNTFEVLNQNAEYDRHFYMDLTDESVENIGTVGNYNALQFKNYKAVYTGTSNIELNKWYFTIASAKPYDIEGIAYVYSQLTIPKNNKKFNYPVVRMDEIENYKNSFEIVSFNTGQFNILNVKNEPVFYNRKIYDRQIIYANNKNISDSDIIFKIENLKNIFIPKGEIEGDYIYYLQNSVPSIDSISAVTSISTFDPYDYNTAIISLDNFAADPVVEEEQEEEILINSDSNSIYNPLDLPINTNNYKVTITDNTNKINYNINISEFNSIIQIYKRVGTNYSLSDPIIGNANIDFSGDFETSIFEPLADGEQVLYFRIKDDYNNLSSPSPTITFVIDTVKPIAPIISTYFLDNDSNLQSFETLSNVYKYQLSGITNNPTPVIAGYVKEKSDINIYLNNNYVGTTQSYINEVLNETRNNSDYNNDGILENIYGFIFKLPNLNPGLNIVTYEIIDLAGNKSPKSQAANIYYTVAEKTTPEVYILDNAGFKIEAVNTNTNDTSFTFFGIGGKNNTYAYIYKTVSGTDILLGKALIKNNSWQYKIENLSFSSYSFKFKIKNTSNVEQTVIKNINIVNNKPTVNITITDTTESRFKKVNFLFNETVSDFTYEDIYTKYCKILKEEKFGITLLKTTDNKSYDCIIELDDNYSGVNYTGLIKLNMGSVYNTNDGTNNETSITINNPSISLLQDAYNDVYNPFNPIITLTITDQVFGTKVLKDGDITNDNKPKISGLNIGAWSEDLIFPLKLTRTFKLPKNQNYNSEILYGSVFDKFRSKILDIQTYSNNDYLKSFAYLQKNCNYFDYLFYKDNETFVFPEYDSTGVLYYRTITLKYDLISRKYSIIEETLPLDNFNASPQIKDLLANQFIKNGETGEYELISNENQEPIVTYQLITNNDAEFNRQNIIKIERFLIIFKGKSSEELIMKLDNPMGISAIEAKYYNSQFLLNYDPQEEIQLKPALFPNYETIETITPLGYNHINFTKTLPVFNSDGTVNTFGKYKITLADSGNNVQIASEPIIVKINMYYYKEIVAEKKNSEKFYLPIKRYQLFDTSNILSLSWINFYVLFSHFEIIDDRIYYKINRTFNDRIFNITFETLKTIKFNNIQKYNLIDFDFSVNTELIKIELLETQGIPFNTLFELKEIFENNIKYLKLSPKENITDKYNYDLLANINIPFKLTFNFDFNNKEHIFSHKYYNEDNCTDLKYFKLLDIVNADKTEILDINLVKHEYEYDIYYESIRQNKIYDSTENYHSDYNEIDDYALFDDFIVDVYTDDPTPIYPLSNKFLFNDNLKPVDRFINKNAISRIPLPVGLVHTQKEQIVVKDLAYYGLEKSCTIIYSNGKFKVKANSSIFLDNKNFIDSTYMHFDDIVFDVYETDSEEFNNLERKPPKYIWVHLDDVDSISPNNYNYESLSEWLGSNPYQFKNPVGKYVAWEWDTECLGDFWINDNQLETLINGSGNGLPSIIKGTFKCNNNILKNLNGGPTTVYGNYIAKNNKLDSLSGLATKIGGLANYYYEPGVTEKWGLIASDTIWNNFKAIFNDTNTNLWDDNILDGQTTGSSLDLSFNSSLLIGAITSLSSSIIGWNIYLAGTGINYSESNIATIKSKLKNYGLIYFYFDTSNYIYLIKNPADPTTSTSNKTNVNNSSFYNSSLTFTRKLDVSDTSDTQLLIKTGTTFTKTDLYTKVKYTSASKNSTLLTNNSLNSYHSTNEEII